MLIRANQLHRACKAIESSGFGQFVARIDEKLLAHSVHKPYFYAEFIIP